jgi:hypothetical protein
VRRKLHAGDRVAVGGRNATFVKLWGTGAVVRYDDAPADPRVVPIARVGPRSTVTAVLSDAGGHAASAAFASATGSGRRVSR